MGAYTTRVLRLFDLIDTSKNGYIDRDDLPRGNGSAGAQAQRDQIVQALITGFIKASDANMDTRVTKQEMLACVERTMVGKSVSDAPAYIREVTAGVFKLMDTDGNGKVSKGEFEQYLKARNITDPNAAGEFARLDRDGDGSLTVEDLNYANHHFFTAPEANVPEHWLLAAVSA
ncbi:EF-hand domain-containing protein [Streptomyces sp. NPDC059378]|uniref:EF-hand domain-containing protein n=1 Tax=Streptomyces sp. NPDC059378 TaxID=3346815 RepID=UPI0036B571B0